MMTEERKKEVVEGLKKAREFFGDGRNKEAQESIDSLIDSLTDEELTMEDDEYEYVDFKSPIEEGIYRAERSTIKAEKDEERKEAGENEPDENDETDKELRLIDFPVSNLYVLSGSIAMEMKDYGRALEQLGQAMEWNPTNPEIAFEYAEVVKRMGSADQFFELTKRIFPHIYSSQQLAHAYRNAAYYYETRRDADKALAMLAFSNGYEENENAKREMQAIMKDTGIEHKQITSDEIRQICEADDIPFGPDRAVIQMAGGNGMYFLEKKNYQMAYYFISIAYDLTRDPQLKDKLDEISRKINEQNND